MEKKRQLNNKTERRKVRLKGEIIEDRRIELGITSQGEAAEKAGLNIRTYQRAIRGEPILVKTTKNICDALKLNRDKVVIIERKKFLPPFGEGERDEEKYPDTEACIKAEAVVAARTAIDSIFDTYEEVGGVRDYIDVLSVILTGYALSIAHHDKLTGYALPIAHHDKKVRKAPHYAAFLFIDDIANDTKELLCEELSRRKKIDESDKST